MKERGADLHLPVGHVVRAVLYAAEDAVQFWREYVRICRATGQSTIDAGVGTESHGPCMLRNCPTFSAAPRIRVSFDTRRVRFASVIMSEDGGSVESVGDAVERRRSSEAAP